jgi:hypothetical protein
MCKPDSNWFLRFICIPRFVIVCFRLANRSPFYEIRERGSDEDVGRVQYDAAAGSVTVYVDGNSGNRYAARPANDSQYNKVILLFITLAFMFTIRGQCCLKYIENMATMNVINVRLNVKLVSSVSFMNLYLK